MSETPALTELVAALPEIYQPIYKHPELSQGAARGSEDRLASIQKIVIALTQKLGRPLRILDLGCAQGWFCFSLASLGAEVFGIDLLDANIAVCKALARENPGLRVGFDRADIETIPERLQDNQFDLFLGLSVFQHLSHSLNKEFVRDLLPKLFAKIPTGLIEFALASEPVAWAPSLPEHPEFFTEKIPFARSVAHHATHLSKIERPLYLCSRSYWQFDQDLEAFESWHDNGRGRRYYFGADKVAKLYRTDGPEAETNRFAIQQSVRFMNAPPPGYTWAPRVLVSGSDAGSAWLVQAKLPGEPLADMIRSGRPYDERSILMQVLDQLAVLEKSGLYHGDLRTWNILVSPDGAATLIDFNEISPRQRDCVWPHDIFLAFLLFTHEVVTHTLKLSGPHRVPFISPMNLPEPYSAWVFQLWRKPLKEWSFAFLRSSLELLPAAGSVKAESRDEMTASDLWIKAMEQHLEVINGEMRELEHPFRRLIEYTVNNARIMERCMRQMETMDERLKQLELRLEIPLRKSP